MGLHGDGQQDLLVHDHAAVSRRRVGQSRAHAEVALGGAGVLDDLEVDEGMHGLELEEDVGQQRRSGQHVEDDGRARMSRHDPELFGEIVEDAHHGLELALQRQPRVVELHALAFAQKQRHAELLLQREHGFADGRLGDVQFLGGLREIFVFSDSHKVS